MAPFPAVLVRHKTVRTGKVRLGAGFVFGAYIAALNGKRPVAVDGDEDPRPRHVGRIVGDGPFEQRADLGIDRLDPRADLLGNISRICPFRFERLGFGFEGRKPRFLIARHRLGDTGDFAHAARCIPRQVDRGRHPFPAFGADLLPFGLQPVGHELIKQGRIGQPAAIVGLEQVAHHAAARRRIGLDADETHPLVGNAHRILGQLLANVMGRLIVAVGEQFPDLFLARMVVRHGKAHQLFERHAVLGIDLVQPGRDRGELQPLAHHCRRRHEMRGNRFDVATLLNHRLHRAELVERVKSLAEGVFGKAVLLGGNIVGDSLDDARDRRVLGQPLLFDQQLERAETPATGRNFERAGFSAGLIEDRADIEALEKRAAGDIFRQFGNGDTRLDPANVGLGQDQPVEGNVPRAAEGDFLNCLGHGSGTPWRAAARLSLGYQARHESRRLSSSSGRPATGRPSAQVGTHPRPDQTAQRMRKITPPQQASPASTMANRARPGARRCSSLRSL